jgi:Ca2+-binding EF-hand superfamily protein
VTFCTDVGRTNSNYYDIVQVFDKHNRGYISASDLRAVLQCLGEDLSEEESKLSDAHSMQHN